MENSSTLISEEIENSEELTEEETVQEEAQEEVKEESETVEQKTTEEPQGKFYTDEEFNQKVNEIADRRVARKMRKVNRELDDYKDTINVLKSQLGGDTIEDVNTNLRKLYENEGVELPKKYVSEDSELNELIAERDFKDFETEGIKSITDEANRLAGIGYENLNSKDKILFSKLVNKIDTENDKKVLKGLNVDESILEDKDFISFRGQFNREVPISKIYDLYSGKKETKINTPGNLENKSTTEREYFTDEEIEALTMEQLDDPKIWEKVRKSQTRNK